MNSDWIDTTLGQISKKISYGYTESASWDPVGPKFLRITDIQNENVEWDKVPFCPISESDLTKYLLNVGDICIARTGNSTGQYTIIKDDINAVFASYLIRYEIDLEIANPFYINLAMKTYRWKGFVKSIIGGSAQPGANAKQFADFPIELPPLEIQNAVVRLVKPIENTITLLQSQNQTLEKIAQTLFKHWFVDFEFPGEDGKPYKSSGGKMVESELDEIPEGWSVGCLGDMIINYDSKRVPISGGDREQRKGVYPYYGATSIMDYVDDYIFDGIYLLMGEDGSVITNTGTPFLQYVWGKIWVNNHAHVLQGKDGFSTEYVNIFLSRSRIGHIVTGAVQPKINQANMNSLEAILPKKNVLLQYDEIIQPIFAKFRCNIEQIRVLTSTRDLLLPKLISGKIRIKGNERQDL